MAQPAAANDFPWPFADGLKIPFDTYSRPVNDNPQALSADDCDGDGVADLISANFDSDTATILTNIGGGTLEYSNTLTTPDKPSGVTCADFNHDNRIDAAVTSWTAKTVTIYLRQEDGTFTVGASSPVGNLPRSVSAADIDGDENVDLVIVNSKSSELTLLFGNGAGGFSATGNIRLLNTASLASAPVSAQIADFNGDGRLDIIVAANQQKPSLHLLLGDDSGFLFHASTKPLPTTGRLRSVAVGDLNGDTIPDIATLGVDASIQLFAGVGDGTFGLMATILTGDSARSIALADFDGDNLSDLAIAHSDSNTIQVLKAVSPGSFRNPYNISTEAVFAPMSNAQLRLSATGSNQIVFVDGPGRRLSMLTVPDTTGPVVTPLANLTGTPQSLVLTDMTNDSIPDAVVATAGPRSSLAITVLRGNSAGGYDAPPTTPVICGNRSLEGGESCDDGNVKKGDGCSTTCSVEVAKTLSSIDTADFNSDGNQDLVIVDAKGLLRLLLGNGNGQFASIQLLAKLKRKTGAALGDFNGDGVQDLAIAPASSGGTIAVLLNDGFGNFTTTPITAPAKLTGPLVAADFDRNGFDDILATQTSKPKGVMLLRSDGDGPLRTFQTTPTPTAISALTAADFDEDGYLDALVEFRTKKQAPILMLGSLHGHFSGAPAIPMDAPGASFAVADVDEDLHQDLVSCTSATSPGCRILYGTGWGSFAGVPFPVFGGDGRGGDIRSLATGDIDGDTNADLVGISRQNSRLVIHFGGPTPASLELETGRFPEALAITDINNDNLPDLLTANGASQDVSIFINVGGRQFAALPPTKLPNPDNAGHVAMAVGDLDGDLLPELFVTQSESNRLTIFKNTGNTDEQAWLHYPGCLWNQPCWFAPQANLSTGLEPRNVILGKLNADAIPDIIAVNHGANSLSVFRSETDGTYTRTTLGSQGFAPWDVVLADLNDDTFDDLLVLNEFDSAPPANPQEDSGEGNIVTFLNDGTGGFPAVAQRHARGRETPIAMCVGNFDGDIHPDVAVASVTSKDVMVLHGVGDGTWNNDERDFLVGNPVGSLLCHDVDGDERTDIVFARRRSGDVGIIYTNVE